MSNSVTLQGNPVSVAGHFPVAGEQAKPFSLVAKDLSDVTLASFAGQRKILNIFPSVDTPTCATSVRKFNEQASALENTVVLCISADESNKGNHADAAHWLRAYQALKEAMGMDT